MDGLAINWTESAVRNLEEAAEYITRDSPTYAAALVVGATRRAESLAHYPWRGRSVPEYLDSSVREVFVGSYRLIYRVHSDSVEILAFVHTARDLAAMIDRQAT